MQRGVYLVTDRPVLALPGVTCQKATFLLPVAAPSSLCVPLLGLPGNYSQRDGATSARKLLISVMSRSQLIQETLGFANVRKEGVESMKGGGAPLSQRVMGSWGEDNGHVGSHQGCVDNCWW